MVEKIQSAAYYDRYPLAIWFGGGPSCKRVFRGELECSKLTGQGRRMYLNSGLAMQGAGMDVFKKAARAGWEVYAIGKANCPQDIPHGLEMGLPLVD